MVGAYLGIFDDRTVIALSLAVLRRLCMPPIPRRFGWVLLGYAVLFATGVTGWSLALPHVGIHRAMLVSLATMLPVCLGFYLINHAGSAGSAYRWTLGIATALLILVESGFTPAALSWLAGSLHGGLGKGSAMGIYSVLLSVGAIVGSLTAGWLGGLFRFDGLLLGTMLLAAAGLRLDVADPTRRPNRCWRSRPMKYDYDFAIIGAGASGLIAADFALKLGARVVP